MIRLVTLVFLVCVPASGVAQPVQVRGGEHLDFTRIVIAGDVGAGWAFGRVDGGFEFRPGRREISYDLARAFDRIPRTRISALEDRGNGRMFLSVECECHGDAFELRGGQMVLDIKDGPAPESARPFQKTLPLFTPSSPASVPDSPPSNQKFRRAGLPLILQRASPKEGLIARLMPPALPPSIREADGESHAGPAVYHPDGAEPTPLPPTDPAPDPRVEETESALLDQIARAAAEGMVDVDLTELQDEIAAATHPLGEPPASRPVPPPAPDPPPPISGMGHIAITSSLDRVTGRLPETEDGDLCIAPALLEIADWGAPIIDGTEIGAYRANLLGEFDIADGEGVTDLVRYFVYVGFGAEALAVIRRHPDDVVRADILSGMAQIMDLGRADAGGPFTGQANCDGAPALWAVLAEPDLNSVQPVNRRAVLLAFGALPSHLRRHLGATLAQRFLESGDTETANAIRRTSDRGDVAPTPELNLLSARLARASGEDAAADARLDELISDGSDVLPEALLEKVDSMLARGGAVPDTTIQLIESLEFEHRGDETGHRLQAALIRALASAVRFDEAFDLLAQSSLTGTHPEEEMISLTDELVRRLTVDASDASFLRSIVAHGEKTANLAAATRQGVAARLLDLGLAGRARAVLDGGGDLPGPKDRFLYARVALLEGKPKVAVGYLAGLDDVAARRLRAKAMEAALDHVGAATEYDALGDSVAEAETAWRGGLWDRLEDREDDMRAMAARLMLREPSDFDRPQDPPLARSRALVAASEETRAVLARILTDVPTPAE